MADEVSDPPVGELLSELARNTGLLVRQEVRLASAEMTIKAKTMGRNLGLIALGGALALLGAIALLIAVIVGLEAVMPFWLSALLVGVAVLGAGFTFVSKGITGIRNIDPLPEQTLETLNADVAWAKEQMR